MTAAVVLKALLIVCFGVHIDITFALGCQIESSSFQQFIRYFTFTNNTVPPGYVRFCATIQTN